MARRADDLLSIFDPNRSSGDGSGTGKRKKPSQRRSSSKKRGFQGLYLTAKQVWLGGSAALLLLLLTFVLGLAVGRPGGGDDPSPALSRTTEAHVMVRADFPAQNPNTQKPITRRAVYKLLVQRHNVRPDAVVDIRVDGENMIVELGPFRNGREAEGWLQKWKLQAARINMAAPFRYHDVLPYVKPSR